MAECLHLMEKRNQLLERTGVVSALEML